MWVNYSIQCWAWGKLIKKIPYYNILYYTTLQNTITIASEKKIHIVLVKLLCGLEASQGPVQEVLSSADCVKNATHESSDEQDSEEGDEIKGSRKKKNKRRKGKLNFVEVFFFILWTSCTGNQGVWVVEMLRIT